MKYLNLGCGSRFHNDWTNVDFVSNHKSVIAHDLRTGIPFADSTFDAVYHSHVLEHFSKAEGERFLAECIRVLKPGGVLRVVVPDLESIARLYVKALDEAQLGSKSWELNYDWILIELYDQAVRQASGGEAVQYLSKPEISNQDFVLSRWGAEAERIISRSRARKMSQDACSSAKENPIKPALKRVYHFIFSPQTWREAALKVILKDEYLALQLGRFRKSGEVHQWMYDRYSLTRLLKHQGMENITLQGPTESQISGWSIFKLDAASEGEAYRPDSLYMEAIKPCR